MPHNDSSVVPDHQPKQTTHLRATAAPQSPLRFRQTHQEGKPRPKRPQSGKRKDRLRGATRLLSTKVQKPVCPQRLLRPKHKHRPSALEQANRQLTAIHQPAGAGAICHSRECPVSSRLPAGSKPAGRGVQTPEEEREKTKTWQTKHLMLGGWGVTSAERLEEERVVVISPTRGCIPRADGKLELGRFVSWFAVKGCYTVRPSRGPHFRPYFCHTDILSQTDLGYYYGIG